MSGGDVMKMTTTSPAKNSKSGPRVWTKGDYEDFDFNYGQIDWSKSKKKKVDPNEPVCPVCNGEAAVGTCAGCN